METRLGNGGATSTSRPGPLCIACGNTRRFWVEDAGGDRLVDLRETPNREHRITACGRCRARDAVVFTYIQ